MPVLPSYRNQSIDLTGFYMRTTLALNGLRGSAVEFPEGAIRDALQKKIFLESSQISF